MRMNNQSKKNLRKSNIKAMTLMISETLPHKKWVTVYFLIKKLFLNLFLLIYPFLLFNLSYNLLLNILLYHLFNFKHLPILSYSIILTENLSKTSFPKLTNYLNSCHLLATFILIHRMMLLLDFHLTNSIRSAIPDILYNPYNLTMKTSSKTLAFNL